MDPVNDHRPDRGGETATSDADSRHLRLTRKISLGDIDDLDGYVRCIAASITDDKSEQQDLVAQGFLLAVERNDSLGTGESLKSALSYWLESRLRDYWRTQHREWRRNSRQATAYALPVPTGLAWEHATDSTAGMPAVDESALVQSRLALRLFNSPEDLRNSRLMGRYRGVPSAAGLATQASLEQWARIEEERALTEPPQFGFISKPDELV